MKDFAYFVKPSLRKLPTMTNLPCPYSQLWLVPTEDWDVFECLVDDGSISQPENSTLFVKTHTPSKPTSTIPTAALDEITSTARRLGEQNANLKKELRNTQSEIDARIRDAQALHTKIGMAEEIIREYRKGIYAILHSANVISADKTKATAILNKIDLFLEDLG